MGSIYCHESDCYDTRVLEKDPFKKRYFDADINLRNEKDESAEIHANLGLIGLTETMVGAFSDKYGKTILTAFAPSKFHYNQQISSDWKVQRFSSASRTGCVLLGGVESDFPIRCWAPGEAKFELTAPKGRTKFPIRAYRLDEVFRELSKNTYVERIPFLEAIAKKLDSGNNSPQGEYGYEGSPSGTLITGLFYAHALMPVLESFTAAANAGIIQEMKAEMEVWKKRIAVDRKGFTENQAYSDEDVAELSQVVLEQLARMRKDDSNELNEILAFMQTVEKNKKNSLLPSFTAHLALIERFKQDPVTQPYGLVLARMMWGLEQ